MDKVSKTSTIDSPMQNFPTAPVAGHTKGKTEHPNLGPKGVDGGFPLKFMEDDVPQPIIQETSSPGMIATPMRKR